jgi:hypothetical protein
VRCDINELYEAFAAKHRPVFSIANRNRQGLMLKTASLAGFLINPSILEEATELAGYWEHRRYSVFFGPVCHAQSF